MYNDREEVLFSRLPNKEILITDAADKIGSKYHIIRDEKTICKFRLSKSKKGVIIGVISVAVILLLL